MEPKKTSNVKQISNQTPRRLLASPLTPNVIINKEPNQSCNEYAGRTCDGNGFEQHKGTT